ncbi:MAG: NAD+ synthase, partial [Gammaproteobacteria bacterium]|nr:NAD+ synthase [Gammaproteobacteria bacterium]NIR97729.1 NAD+ synthase [Gammaproteobacteria bacterium]NIT63307.1 NAD+ synthase [Gammaproteobacteria bacterium]NIV20668.1 NAD+ synthase [Gammaproteobacteria bacterium]NIX11379.1 NAD+ synthase [Gammaproteobacteria bacterium]
MTRPVRIVMAQLNMLVGDVDGNAAKIVDAAERARDELQADVVVVPELAVTGYPPEDLLLRPGLRMDVLRGVEEIKRR